VPNPHRDASQEFWDQFWSSQDSSFLLQRNSDPFLIAKSSAFASIENVCVLEAGCGDGRNTKYLASRGLNIIALDQSPTALARNRANLVHTPCLTYVQSSAEFTGLASSSVDVAVYIDLLNHLVDWEAAVVELHRILKPGGMLLANPLSTLDASRDIFAKSANKIADSTYWKEYFWNRSRKKAELIMHYASKESIFETFGKYFDFVEEPSENERTDPPHHSPFQNLLHSHVYWQIVARGA
jgi:ubiquinone/menaquinone biosynthesis C-methylase UbiE